MLSAPQRFEVHCLDLASGKTIWKRVATEGKPRIPKHKDNTYATETPVTDGERVYASFGMNGLYCYDFSGKQLWKADLGTYPIAFGHGTASSPLLYKDRLIVFEDHAGRANGGSFIRSP